MPGPADTYIAYGQGWANVVEHAVPRVQALGPRGRHQHAARSPTGRPASRRKGELRQQPGHLIDVMATCVDLAGGDVSRRTADAIRRWRASACGPAFDGKPLDRAAPIFWEHEATGRSATGEWKLVAKHGQAVGAVRPRLVPPQTRDGYPVRQGTPWSPGRPTPTSPTAAAGPTCRNTPFRRYKHWVHEGGSPPRSIAHWPAGIRGPRRLDRSRAT